VDLNHPHFNGLEGVYIIWHGGAHPSTVYVGQGVIKDRLATHRQEKDILQFSSFGLFVTWAKVDGRSHDGVERFLADKLQPKVPGLGARYPAAAPIPVNLPW
jgi:hypothetical protein